jgi:hypothetical protein
MAIGPSGRIIERPDGGRCRLRGEKSGFFPAPLWTAPPWRAF